MSWQRIFPGRSAVALVLVAGILSTAEEPQGGLAARIRNLNTNREAEVTGFARELAQCNRAVLLYEARTGGGSIFRLVFADPQRWETQ